MASGTAESTTITTPESREGLSRPSKVIIVGGGLGGSFLALCLARRGIKSEIYETRPTREDIGGAISLFPNATRCLEHAGIVDTVLAHGFKYTNMHMVDENGALIGKWPTGGGKLGHEACRIRRSTLHQIILDAMRKTGLNEIYYDKHVTNIKSGDSSVTAVFRDGTNATGDYLIGCDGIHSTVRKELFGSACEPQYQGVASVGGIVDYSDLRLDTSNLPSIIYGQKGTVGIMPFGDSTKHETLLNWFCTLEVPQERDRAGWAAFGQSGEALSMARERLKAWGAPVSTLLDRTQQGQCSVWAQYKVPSPEKWYKGRCVIIGDAAHAIPPSAGQGAAQAFEDGELLARVLAEGGTFEAFQTERNKRIALIIAMTKDSGDLRKTGEGGRWAFLIKKSFMKVYFYFFASGRGAAIYTYDATNVPTR